MSALARSSYLRCAGSRARLAISRRRLTTVKEKEGALRLETPVGLSSNDEVSDDPRNWPDPYRHQTLAGAIFTPDECSKIVRTGLGLAPTRASVKINGEDQLRWRSRYARISWIVSSETTQWIFQTVAAAVAEANSARWHYDLQPIERLQFTEYGFGGHYRLARGYRNWREYNPKTFLLRTT